MNEPTEPAIPGNELNALLNVVDSVLERLRPRDRELILLRFFEGRTFPQIAEVVGSSADATRLKVERALERLRHLLARRGITSTSAVLTAAIARAGTAVLPEAAGAMIHVAAAMGRAGGTSVTTFGASKIVAWTAVPIAAAAWIVATHQTGELARLRHRSNSANPPPAIAKSIAASPVQASATPVPIPATAPTESISPEETRLLYDLLQKRLHTDPRLLALKLERSRENIRGRYAPLFESLELNETQREAFIRLQMEKTAAGLRLAAKRYERDLAETDTGYLALVEQHRRDILEPIERSRRELLGPVVERVQAFEAALPVAPLAESLAASLHFSANPLSSGQAVAFMSLAQAANTAHLPNPDWSNLDLKALLVKASDVLSEPQVSALKALLAQAHRQAEIEQRTDEIMREIARQGAR